MDEMLRGKIVLVTGGTSGIGRSIAVLCAAQGATVLIAGRRKDCGVAVVREIELAGGKAEFVATDISVEQDIRRLFETIANAWGKLDCAVNNAGVQIAPASISDVAMEEFDRLYLVNQRGPMICMQLELRMMREQRSGSIVNVSSIAGVRGIAFMAPYVATKHALVGLSKTAAMEMAATGIRVNCICPGSIKTEMLDSLILKDPKYINAITDGIPMGRLGVPDEIGHLAVWLLSSQASFITGQVITVDGGHLEAIP